MGVQTILMALGLLTGASAATAAYPVNEVLREETDQCGRKAVLRRGYWNGTQGFGFDKMYHKHNLKHTGVFAFVLGNPNCGEESGGEARKYDAYAHHVECSIFDCEVVEIRRVFMVVDYRHDAGIPGQKGVITAYCGNEERCADWVDESINVAAISTQSKARSKVSKRATWSYTPLSKDRKYKPEELRALPK